jgi:release factor glutamine methyltransferase
MTPGGTIAEALRAATRRLTAAGLETPRLDAEVLLRHLLGVDRTTLFLRYHDPIDPARLAAYEELLGRRLGGQPVAYLTGQRAFLGLTLTVTPEILVPRPETELLVEWARDWLLAPGRDRVDVVDVGTGGGAIAIGLASLLPDAWAGRITAVDVSRAALMVAAANHDQIQSAMGRPSALGRVTFQASDLLESVAGLVDLVLANLPYLTPEQIDGNADLAAEPRLALDGGPDGLDLIRRLVADLPRVLAAGGAVALELDPGQAEIVAALLRMAESEASVAIHHDLAGHARFVTMERPDGR